MKYLFNTEGSDMTAYQKYGTDLNTDNAYDGDDINLLYDYVVEVPAELADETGSQSIILQIDFQGTPFYYQVR